jgi:hypothetical protein
MERRRGDAGLGRTLENGSGVDDVVASVREGLKVGTDMLLDGLNLENGKSGTSIENAVEGGELMDEYGRCGELADIIWQRKKGRTVEIEDNVIDGLGLLVSLAEEGVFEATEPGLLDVKVAVLDLLELNFEGEAPAVDGCLGVTVEMHGTGANSDPDESLAAGEELDARMVEGGGERLLERPLIEDVDMGALPCGLPECLEDEIDSLLSDCDDLLETGQDSLADDDRVFFSDRYVTTAHMAAGRRKPGHGPFTTLRARAGGVRTDDWLINVDDRQLVPRRYYKWRFRAVITGTHSTINSR